LSTQAAPLSELPDDLREAAQRFVVATSLIDLDETGLPCNPEQAFLVGIQTDLAHRLVHALSGSRPSRSDIARQVWALADAWCCVMAGTNDGQSHVASMGRRWLEARADAPDLMRAMARPVAIPDHVTPDLIESLRDSSDDPDGVPTIVRTITDADGNVIGTVTGVPSFDPLIAEPEHDPIDDYPDIEGGYRWRRDQPPEPLGGPESDSQA